MIETNERRSSAWRPVEAGSRPAKMWKSAHYRRLPADFTTFLLLSYLYGPTASDRADFRLPTEHCAAAMRRRMIGTPVVRSRHPAAVPALP